MNRIDRLLGHILALQRGRTQTAEQLAVRFEVSKRTVYRDLEALDQIGVPIVAIPGRGYQLSSGFHLPPTMFTAEEASSLALAGALFRHFVAHEGLITLDTALRKIDVVLPELSRVEVAETQRRVRLVSWPHEAAPLDSELPLLLRRAMRERRRIRVSYHARTTNEQSDRVIDPHALVYYAGDWHLLGYCHLRGAVRQFRLSRMESPRLLDERFEMPPEADAQRFWAANNPGRTGECIARVRFSIDVTRWVRERRHYSWEREEESPEGLVVTLRADRWDEVIPWILGWGAGAEVLSPPELRRTVAAEARRTSALYVLEDQPEPR